MRILVPLAIMAGFAFAILAPLERLDAVLLSRFMDWLLYTLLGAVMLAFVVGAWWWALSG